MTNAKDEAIEELRQKFLLAYGKCSMIENVLRAFKDRLAKIEPEYRLAMEKRLAMMRQECVAANHEYFNVIAEGKLLGVTFHCAWTWRGGKYPYLSN